MTGNLNACPLAPYHVLTVIHESPSYETTLTLQPIKDTQIMTIAHAFFQKMAPKSPKIFITFSDTY